jgi:hypothetical protein
MDEQRVTAAFEKRLEIYRTKLSQANPLAEDDRNRHDALSYVVEAIEILAREAGVPVAVDMTDDELAIATVPPL